MTQTPAEILDQVSSPEDLAKFIKALKSNLAESPDQWENLTLPHYLEAMSAWLKAASNPHSQAHDALSDGPSWRTFAKILWAASAYE